jgi:hypothetical protein
MGYREVLRMGTVRLHWIVITFWAKIARFVWSGGGSLHVLGLEGPS